MSYEQVYIDSKQWALDYIRGVMPTEEGIIREGMCLKVAHTFRVIDATKDICMRLQTPDRHTYIAMIAALLHDIGRFQQLAEHSCFLDSKLDHGDAGADLIDTAGVLRGLSDEDRAAVITAVRHHNDYSIPALLTHHELLFIRLLRDADKLDILHQESELHDLEDIHATYGAKLHRTTGISSKIVQAMDVGITIPRDWIKNVNEARVALLAWIFDLNYPATVRIIANRGIFDNLAATLPATTTTRKVFDIINHFSSSKFGYRIIKL